MIRCSKCGTINKADASFCTECNAYLEWSGEKVENEEPASASSTEPDVTAPSPPAEQPGQPDEPQTAGQAVPKPSAPSGQQAQDPPSAQPAPSRPPEPVPPPRKPTPLPPQPRSRKPEKEAAAPSPKPRLTTPVKAEMPKPSDRVCPNCGTGNEPQRKFCRKCGQGLVAAPMAPPLAKLPWYKRLFGRGGPATTYEAGSRPASMGSGRGWRPGCATVVVFSILMLTIGGVLLYLYVPAGAELVDEVVFTVRSRIEPLDPVAPSSPAGDARAGFPASNALDDNTATYWLAPQGPNDRWRLSFSFQEDVDLRQIAIDGGAPNEERGQFARPREVVLRSGAEVLDRWEVKDRSGTQYRRPDEPIQIAAGTQLDLVVLSAWQADQDGDDDVLAIREILFGVPRG